MKKIWKIELSGSGGLEKSTKNNWTVGVRENEGKDEDTGRFCKKN